MGVGGKGQIIGCLLYGKVHSKRVTMHEEKGRRDGERSEKVALAAVSSVNTEQVVLCEYKPFCAVLPCAIPYKLHASVSSSQK